MRLSWPKVRSMPACRSSLAPRVVSQAVAATAKAATVTEATTRRVSRLRRIGTSSAGLGRVGVEVVGHLVAHAVDGEQVAGFRAGLDLAPQVHDVDVDGAIEGVVVETEGLGEQLLAAERPARLGGQAGQDGELGRRAVDERPRPPHLVAHGVDLELADPVTAARPPWAAIASAVGPPQHG